MPGTPPAPRARLSAARTIPLVLALGGLVLAALALPRTGHAQYPDDYPDEVPPTPTITPTRGPSPTPTPAGRPPARNLLHLQAVAADQGRLTTFAGIGCAGDVRPGSHATLTFTSGGIMRTTLVRTPANAEAGAPMPVVLNFHGLAANGAIQEDLSGLAPVSDTEGFLLVSPDGVGQPSGWNALLPNSAGTDDVRFVSDLIDEVEREFCVDQDRIYAIGFSNGAMLASLVGCELGDRIAAVVAVAGAWNPPEPCTRRTPILGVHGKNDDVVPFDGGTIIGVAPYQGVRYELAGWATAMSTCPWQLTIQSLAPAVTLESYAGCGVELIVLEHLGHAPPDGSTPELIWAFLQRYTT